jgi:hypothetical protein
MTLCVSSVFAADRAAVFEKLKQVSTLQCICAPMAAFEPMDGCAVWAAGTEFRLKLRVMGIDFGVHAIRVEGFGIDGIATHESNRYVPLWKHRIALEDLGGGRTRYTDNVEIRAGAKTPFVWMWANLFYRHRQRKWKELL